MMEASNQWATRPRDQRYKSLAELRAAVYARRLRSRSVDVDLTRVKAEVKDDQLIFNSVIAPSEPTHWAFTQFAGLLKAPAAYLRQLPKPLLNQCLNHGLQNAPRDSVKFMTIESVDDRPNTLQAVTSPTYGRIWDANCVDAVGRIVERSGGKFHNPLAYSSADRARLSGPTEPSGLYASDRDIFMFMIDGGSRLEAGPRAKLHRGFFVKNSEVGAATFTLTTFLFNEVCGNHIVWGAQNINRLVIRHTQGGPERFDSQALPALMDYANSTAHTEEQTVRKAMDYLLPTEEEAFLKLVAPFKFTRPELKSARDFAKAEEGECRTLWDLIQGLTAYARGYDWIDARTDLEARAGKLLDLVA